MRARTPGLLLLVAAVHAAVAGLPRRGGAATQVNGTTFAENTTTAQPGDGSNLFQTGLSLDIVPPEKKKLRTNLNMRFNYVRSDEDELAHFSPFGNLGLDLTGETFSLNLQHSRYATLGTATQLTETTLSRASASVVPKSLPHVSVSVSRTDAQTGSSPSVIADNGSINGDYQYRWLQVRGGYSADRREAGGPSNRSSSAFAGFSGTYEVLPAAVLTAGVDLNRFEAESAAGSASSTDTRALRLNADSRPFSWLELMGNLSHTKTSFESGTLLLPDTTQRLAEATATVLPLPSLRVAGTLGNRRFDDVGKVRSVDFRILSAAFSRELRERILVGANASRSYESDLGQGENVTDSVAVNAIADLTSLVALRVNASVSRSEDRTFVSARTFNASGTLADRDRLDQDAGGLPSGFTFFDTLNNDVYTKSSSALGEWTLTSHLDPVTGRYAANRSAQVTAKPTDRMSVALSYASTASADDARVVEKLGNQSLNGSLSYLATRRSSLGLSGTAFFPEEGDEAFSATGSYSYRFVRGHHLNLSYARQLAARRRIDASSTLTARRQSDSLSASLTLSFRKRTSMEFTYLATQLLRDEQTDFVRVRLSHTF